MKKFLSVFIVAFFIANSLNVASAASANPTSPQIYLPTGISITGKTTFVKSGDNLQAVIDQATPGDEIVLQAAAVFPGPIILKNKIGSGWITIHTESVPLQSNARMTPAATATLAKIVAPGNNAPALETEPGAHNYRIIGVEFRKISPSAVTDTLVLAGDGSSTQNTLAQVPHDLIFDRVYIHGDPTTDTKRGIGLNSASTEVVNSYISDIHGVGFDSQAIAGWNGPGPFTIVNNYLEGAAENFLLGGSDPSIPGLVPSDIYFAQNYVYKPRNWKVGDPTYAGKHWAVKNIFELKNAQRALIENNIFDGSWVDGQAGYAILFTPRNQDGTCPQCVVQDITFQNNIVQHAAAGFQLLGHDYSHPSQLTQRIKIQNNIWDDLNGAKWGGGNGWWGLIDSGTSDAGPSDIQLIHNTVNQTGNFLTPASYLGGSFISKPNATIENNIGLQNQYGIIGDNAGVGADSLKKYFPQGSFAGNIMIGATSNQYTGYANNFFPTSATAVFVGSADYHVQPGSAYHNAGTDGLDPGAAVDAILAATQNVINGSNPIAITSTPTPASISAPTPVPVFPVVAPIPIATPYITFVPVPPIPTPVPTRISLMRAEGDPKVYYITQSGMKRWIPTEAVFNSYGDQWSAVQVVDPSVLNNYPTNNLIRLAAGSRVYLINGLTKRWITSAATFIRLGYRWQDIAPVNQAELNAYATGSAIN